jgi:hypothetical protein
MITGKDIETLYMVNPFGGEDGGGTEESEQALREAGMDLDDILAWTSEHIPVVVTRAAQIGMPADLICISLFVSALRIGFFLGRGYQDDDT